MNFEGKVAIVTGSSSGIGQSIVLLLAKRGACVTVHGTNEEKLKNTVSLLHFANIPDDKILVIKGAINSEVTVNSLINETIAKFGRIDILVNNAGAYEKPGNTDYFCMETFDYTFDVNLKYPILLSQLAKPHLAKTQGNIINISSSMAKLPFDSVPFYSASKAALECYTRSSAIAYAPQKIRVNAVSPGLIDTPFYKRNSMPEDFADEYKKDEQNRTAMKRAASGDEVAEVVVFLASNAASYVTGAIWAVDGGVTAGCVPRDK